VRERARTPTGALRTVRTEPGARIATGACIGTGARMPEPWKAAPPLDCARAGTTVRTIRAAMAEAFLPTGTLPVHYDAVYPFGVSLSPGCFPAHRNLPCPLRCSLPLWSFIVTCVPLLSTRSRRFPSPIGVALPADGLLCYNHGALWSAGGFSKPPEARNKKRRGRRLKTRRGIVPSVRRGSKRTSAS